MNPLESVCQGRKQTLDSFHKRLTLEASQSKETRYGLHSVELQSSG